MPPQLPKSIDCSRYGVSRRALLTSTATAVGLAATGAQSQAANSATAAPKPAISEGSYQPTVAELTVKYPGL
jgi:hypothetical protein